MGGTAVSNDTVCKLVALFVGVPALVAWAVWSFFAVLLGVPLAVTIFGG